MTAIEFYCLSWVILNMTSRKCKSYDSASVISNHVRTKGYYKSFNYNIASCADDRCEHRNIANCK